MNHKDKLIDLYQKQSIYMLALLFLFTVGSIGGFLNSKVFENNNCSMPVLAMEEIYFSVSSEHFIYYNSSNIIDSSLADNYRLFMGNMILSFSIGDFLITCIATPLTLLFVLLFIDVNLDIGKILKELKIINRLP